MFCSWAISSWALTDVVRSQVKTKGGKIGLIFLIAAGVGEAMASVFPVPTALHNVAGMIGIPSLPVAAILISRSLSHNAGWFSAKNIIMRTAHLTWISFVLMTASMIVMFNGLSKTGGKITPEVIAVGGWANRILIIMYCVWVFTVAFEAIRLQKRRDW